MIKLNSTCADFPDNAFIFPVYSLMTAGCQNLKKAIILIIDALRYDFATYNSSVNEKDALPYINKMPIF